MNGIERLKTVLRGGTALPLMPITMMAAADHIGIPYLEYATDYRTMAKAQLAIADAYDFDYVSVISDPAVEAADCGATVVYHDDQPPAIDENNAVLANKSKLLSLSADPKKGVRMANRIEAARRLAEDAGHSLVIEGWVEGPCAEGADLRGINRLMLDFYDNPSFVRDLFEFVVDLGTRFAVAQIKAGATLIGIGDAAASLVGPQIYGDFVFEYERRMIEAVKNAGAITRLHICGNISAILEKVGELGVDIVDLDSMVPVDLAREKTDSSQVLLGNIDPVRVLRNGAPDDVRRELERCKVSAGNPYIAGAGCEVPRDTPPANLHAMREFARSYQA